MRVLFLTHSFPRWPGDSAGVALSWLARALSRRGIKVRVLAPGDTSNCSIVDGVPVHWVPVAPRLSRAVRDGDEATTRSPLGWNAVVRLCRAFRSALAREIAEGVDVVHAHGWTPVGLAAPKQLPVVLTVGHRDGGLLRRSRIARAFARPLLRRATVVTAVSRHTGESVQSVAGRFVAPEQTHPMPIDTRGLPWTRGGAGMVVLSSLSAAGRVDLALDAGAALVAAGHRLPLIVIGDGPERPSLERRAGQLGIGPLVRFVGDLPLEQVRQLLSRADLAVITGQGDGTAFPAMEALISGVPVVACWDSGPAIDIVPQSGAGRLSIPSADAIAENLLALQRDKDRLAIGRLVGESWRARLAPDHVAQLCETWYRDALAR